MTRQPPTGHFEALRPEGTPVKLLIVAPHPDDEVIGPGGRARLEREHGVGAIVVTDGARGAGGRREPGLKDRRRRESVLGLRRIGAAWVWFLDVPSETLRRDPVASAADSIRWAVETWRPATVLTTAPFEHHPTHLATTRATLAALRATPPPRPGLLGFPVWDPLLGEEGVESVVIDSVLEEKLHAVKAHESQLAVRPFDEVIRCRHFLDAQLAALTGPETARYVERYVDLSGLLATGAPTLDEWVRQRVENHFKDILSGG